MDQNTKKFNVAKAVIEYIHNDCILGMGTGSTVNFLIEMLPDVRNKISGIASSSLETERLLKSKGFDVQPLSDFGNMDLYIDGADEATKNLHLIKGGGGALTREKIIASSSRKFICIIDDSKLVKSLGHFPVPIEILPMAQTLIEQRIIEMSGKPVWRKDFITDNGNYILDIHDLKISDPIKMEGLINEIPGVISVGIFAKKAADILLIGDNDGIKEIRR